MAGLNLVGLNKIYDNNVQAVFDFNLEVEDGEFIVLVGPSGCGKTTTLRMIAGLEDITSGELFIDGVNVTQAPPKNRDIAMVFQNYALYAHMTVYQNMAFSLTLQRANSDLIHTKVMAAAEILGLTDQLNKKPRNLSGGQRQRVAVGRAIVRSPKVFLFDEPLSNLDAKLRGSMRRELKLLHNKLGVTIVYVTHDQIEALTLADRIVVMDKGYVQQVGTPLELYSHPCNLFVAGFIGLPPMNFLSFSFDGQSCNNGEITFSFDSKTNRVLSAHGKDHYTLGFRPENAVLGGNIDMVVVQNENLGQSTLVHGKLGSKKVTCKFAGWHDFKAGQTIKIGLDMDKVHFFDEETTQVIRKDNV